MLRIHAPHPETLAADNVYRPSLIASVVWCDDMCSLTVSPDVVPHDVKVVAIIVRVEAVLHVICPTDTST